MFRNCSRREREAATYSSGNQNLVLNDLPPVDRLARSFSSLHKPKRATAWLLRFCAYLTDRHCKETFGSAGPLTYSELENAERVLIA